VKRKRKGKCCFGGEYDAEAGGGEVGGCHQAVAA
jgi:hypothetical protein